MLTNLEVLALYVRVPAPALLVVWTDVLAPRERRDEDRPPAGRLREVVRHSAVKELLQGSKQKCCMDVFIKCEFVQLYSMVQNCSPYSTELGLNRCRSTHSG